MDSPGMPIQPLWSDLTQEALVHVFSRLDFLSLVCASRVCRTWHDATRFQEPWDHVHRKLHAGFLDSMIRETNPAEEPWILNSKARYIVTRSGVRATSICIDSIADNNILHEIAQRCPQLESLSLRYCRKIPQGTFCMLFRSCKILKLVDLTGYKQGLSAEALEELGQSCPALIGLNLSGMQMSEADAVAIGTFMPQLTWLNLKNARISKDQVLVILSMCKKLEYLNLQGSYPVYVDQEITRHARAVAEFKWESSPSHDIDASLADNWFSTLY